MISKGVIQQFRRQGMSCFKIVPIFSPLVRNINVASVVRGSSTSLARL